MTAIHSMSLVLRDALIQGNDLEPLQDRQQIAAVVVALSVLLLVLELVRRRKLREEYSWLWAATAMLLIVLALYRGFLVELSRLVGAANTASTLFLGALLFLLALSLQFSVRLSRLTHRNRTLAQRLALLEQEIERQRGEQKADDAGGERQVAERIRPKSKKKSRGEVA